MLFLVAMPLKYGLKMESAIKVPGMVHGLLFLAYIGFTFLLFLKEKWRFGKLLTGWACGFVPLATFWFEGRVRREAVLAR